MELDLLRHDDGVILYSQLGRDIVPFGKMIFIQAGRLPYGQGLMRIKRAAGGPFRGVVPL